MIDHKKTLTLLQETMQSFAPFYREDMDKAIQDTDAPDDWFTLLIASGINPKPLSVDHYQTISPYAARERRVKSLQKLAELELMEPVGPDVYQLTDLGRESVELIYKAAQSNLAKIQPLPQDEMEELEATLFRLVNAVLEADEPDEKWSIASSRSTDPGKEATGLVLIDQYLTDLVRYRDDAHITAWKKYESDGQAWEALSLIWREEAGSAAELFEKLQFRGHSLESYETALSYLEAQGLIEETPGGYRATDAGVNVREKAEQITNQLYYAPWECLNKAETTRFLTLLEKLQNEVKKMEKEGEKPS
ncbi:MAG: hypothetical protein JXA42_12675 [Anaerolineales bacterium]|nr:hypothetical protein [Anaerolineales bacterium]